MNTYTEFQREGMAFHSDLFKRSLLNERFKDDLERTDEDATLRSEKLSVELANPGSRFDSDAVERIRGMEIEMNSSSSAFKFKKLPQINVIN